MIPTNMYQKISEELNKLGFTLISKKIGNVAKKMVVVDSDGYMYYSSLSNIRKSKKLPFISDANPFKNRNLNLFFINKGLSSTPISLLKTGKYYSIEIICKCGVKYTAYWDNVSKEKRMYQQYCPKCSKKFQSELHKIGNDVVFDEFRKRKLIPLFDRYKTSVTKYPCQNQNGYKGMMNLQEARSGTNITPFSPSNPFAIENITLFLDRNGVRSKLLSDSLLGNSSIPKCRIEMQCECGERYSTYLSCILQMVSTRCKKCSKSESRYSILTRNYLTDIGVIFETEQKMDGCISTNSLKFDYAIIVRNKVKLLIEVDGEFHYDDYSHIYPDSFLKQKERDNIKNRYCLQNNIPLLRIPYWDYKGEEYKKKIISFIKEYGITNTT